MFFFKHTHRSFTSIITISNCSKHVFKWTFKTQSLPVLDEFTGYLKNRVLRRIKTAALTKTAHLTDTTVVIAADEGLRFFHIQPLLVAFAEAGITRYGFETKYESFF